MTLLANTTISRLFSVAYFLLAPLIVVLSIAALFMKQIMFLIDYLPVLGIILVPVYFVSLFSVWLFGMYNWVYFILLILLVCTFLYHLFQTIIKNKSNFFRKVDLYFCAGGVLLVLVLPFLADYSIEYSDILVNQDPVSLRRVTSIFDKTYRPSDRFKQLFFVWGETGCEYRPQAWSSDSRYLLYSQRIRKGCGMVDTYTFDTLDNKVIEGDSLNIYYGLAVPYIWEDQESQIFLEDYVKQEILLHQNDNGRGDIYVKQALISPDQQRVAFTVAKWGTVLAPEDLFILEVDKL